MILRALDDRSLSSKAVGILVRILESLNGQVPSASELATMTRDGRESMLSGLRELRDAGYLVTVTVRDVHGHYRTVTSVVPDGTYALEPTGVGFPDSQYSSTALVGTAQSLRHEAIGLLNTTCLEVRRPGVVEGAEDMDPKEIFGPGAPVDDPPGYRLEQPPKARPPAITSRVTKASLRHGKPHDEWSVHDLGVEFVSLVHRHCPAAFGQVNQGALRRHLSAWLKEGASRAVLVRGIRGFFADERNYRGSGDGYPLWLRFVSWMPRQQARLREELIAPEDYLKPIPRATTTEDDKWLADLESMRERIASGKSRLL